jgi:hypothetical protein
MTYVEMRILPGEARCQPSALGDGIVDGQDMLVWAEHIVADTTDVNDVSDL